MEIIVTAHKIIHDHSAKIFVEGMTALLYQCGYPREAYCLFSSAITWRGSGVMSIECVDRESYQCLKSQNQFLKKNADQFHDGIRKILLGYPGRKPIEILVTSAIITSPFDSLLPSGIHIGDIGYISKPILDSLQMMLESPDEKWVLIQLGRRDDARFDETQVAMTATCQSLVSGATVQSAIGRKREQYWHLPDLENLRLETRKMIEANKINTKDVLRSRWIGTDIPTRQNWRSFEYAYRLIENGDGIIYQLGKNIDVEKVREPILKN